MNHILKIKPYFKLIFSFLVLLFFCFIAQTSFAKEYYYQDFEVNIAINQDSTFDVAEKQTYYLDGNFGFFNRDVALNKIDAVTDIEVFDEGNNKISKSELDIKSRSGAKHIQWNFPRRDFNQKEKSWTVKYKVHGGIGFLKNYDEIYWNAVPSVRDVPIKNVKITISLPNNEKFRSDLIRLYAEDISSPILEQDCLQCRGEAMPINSRDEALPHLYEAESDLTSIGGYYFSDDNREAIFWGKNIKPNANFTIAAGFQKGIVSQSAYFKDFLSMYYGYILSIIIFLSCVIIGFVYWYKTEKSREGKRAIVPQYEPPQNLRPAMAEVIVKEKLTNKGLAATIIDLAVRGYVRIEEEKKTKFEHIIKNIPRIVIISFVIVIIVSITSSKIPVSNSYYYLVYILFPFIGLMIMYIFASFITTPIENKNLDYIITKTKPYENNPDLEEYEKEYLKALFSLGDYFSTKEIKKSPSKSRELYKKIKKLKDKVYEETELDTVAFEKGLTVEKSKNIIFGVLFFVALFVIFAFIGELGEHDLANSQFMISTIVIIISIVSLYTFIKYEACLSDEGIKLKEDWLGFKMYLETAEKYRMQNLKPEYFEKYLPYAMIFGVEKKWAKAFEHLNMPSPNWYVSSAYAAGVSSPSSPAGSFSPSVFSASFTSSFSSAISSSGASGASGGGGGAGGGGGGGGGGAG